MEDDIIVVGESWAEVDGQPDCGRLHVFKMGPEEAQGSVEEGSTVVSETETDSEPGGGISGYPLWSVGVAILVISLILYMKQNNQLSSLHRIR